MTMITTAELWIVIAAVSLGTFLVRFSFLGLVGDRELPNWALRLLRYTPVAVLPGLVAPAVVWPPATLDATDLARYAAVMATVIVGWRTKNLVLAIIAGVTVFFALGSF